VEFAAFVGRKRNSILRVSPFVESTVTNTDAFVICIN
jgi:hypothetical protein